MSNVGKIEEKYEVGSISLLLRLTRGFERPMAIDGSYYSIDDAKDIVKAINFAIQRLSEHGLVPDE